MYRAGTTGVVVASIGVVATGLYRSKKGRVAPVGRRDFDFNFDSAFAFALDADMVAGSSSLTLLSSWWSPSLARNPPVASGSPRVGK